MNIFLLDNVPRICAKYHCDKHVVKMVLETAQILSTVARGRGYDVGYKPTHKNHPSVVWAGRSEATTVFTYQLGIELGLEYTHRYGKTHKSSLVIEEIGAAMKIDKVPCVALHSILGGGFHLAISKELQEVHGKTTQYPGQAVTAYRQYYFKEKYDICTWTNRPKPKWWLSQIKATRARRKKSRS